MTPTGLADHRGACRRWPSPEASCPSAAVVCWKRAGCRSLTLANVVGMGSCGLPEPWRSGYASGLRKTGLALQSPSPIAFAAVQSNEVYPPPCRFAFLNLVRCGG
jgi:hypothetical protein